MNTESNIQSLLDRFFEGQTSLQEEQQIYAYFLSDDVAPEHLPLREMFADMASASYSGLEAEAEQQARQSRTATGRHTTQGASYPARNIIMRRLHYAAASVAACLMLTVGMKQSYNMHENLLMAQLYEGSYVVDNGHRTDDVAFMRSYILEAEAMADKVESRMQEEELMQHIETTLLNDCKSSAEREQLLLILY